MNIDYLIGQPTEIVCDDSLLLFYDGYEKQQITVFDINNNKCIRRFLNKGRGPEEVIPPLKLFVSDHKLYVFQMQTGYLTVYHMKDVVDTLRQPVAVQKYVFMDRPANIKQIKTGFVGIGMFDNGRFRLYDQNAENIGATGKYPFRGEDMEPKIRFFVYQGNLCSRPDGAYFAFGSAYCAKWFVKN